MPEPFTAEISRRTGIGMLTLRGDLASPALSEAVESVTGCGLPEIRRIVFGADHAVAWMSPDELMLFGPLARATRDAARIEAALADAHALVVDVSDARAIFRVSGRAAREVIAKGAPVDLAPGVFEPGDFRRTRIGQVAGAIWMPQESVIDLMCFRSVSDYMSGWLETSARNDAFPGILVDAGMIKTIQSA